MFVWRGTDVRIVQLRAEELHLQVHEDRRLLRLERRLRPIQLQPHHEQVRHDVHPRRRVDV
jgi:hypothetical protein